MKDNLIIKENNFYVYPIKEFNTVTFYSCFELEYTLENYILGNAFIEFINKANKKYPDQLILKKRRRELYNIYASGEISKEGKKLILYYGVDFLSPSALKEDILDEFLEFYRDILFEADFTRQDILDEIKLNHYNRVLHNFDTPHFKGGILFKNAFTDNEIYKLGRYESPEEYQSWLDMITLDKLEKFRDELANKYFGGYAVGNLTDEEFEKCAHVFDFKVNSFDYDYDYDIKINDKSVKCSDDRTTDSELIHVYKINNFDVKNRYMYRILYRMLDSSNGLMMNVLRDEMDIVYSAMADIGYISQSLSLRANINSKNYLKAKEAFNIVMDRLHDKKIFKEYFEREKVNFVDALETATDSLGTYISYTEFEFLKFLNHFQNQIDLVKACKWEDVYALLDDLEFKFEFYCEGDKNE